MTRMSDPHSRSGPGIPCNLLELQSGSPLARPVHALRSVVGALSLLLLPLVGCVIPPSLRVEEDAGVNSPPAITEITSDQLALAEPGPIVVERGETAGKISVALLDTDVGDTLYVRLYVDYNMPDRLPPRVRCSPPVSKTSMRTATCELAGLCATSDVGVQRNLSIVVFDRQPDDSGIDPQSMMDTGGLSTSRFYFLNCQLPQT